MCFGLTQGHGCMRIPMKHDLKGATSLSSIPSLPVSLTLANTLTQNANGGRAALCYHVKHQPNKTSFFVEQQISPELSKVTTYIKKETS